MSNNRYADGRASQPIRPETPSQSAKPVRCHSIAVTDRSGTTMCRPLRWPGL